MQRKGFWMEYATLDLFFHSSRLCSPLANYHLSHLHFPSTHPDCAADSPVPRPLERVWVLRVCEQMEHIVVVNDSVRMTCLLISGPTVPLPPGERGESKGGGGQRRSRSQLGMGNSIGEG